ncbi:DUF2510 domain-containing protein [Mycobacterium hackensackense]|uniref:DUF2510 domain-containing protein n=1 Tax=Mycobacterium hackensackense TaxID=228909 RepID=UPI003556ACD7|nr:DUF2510 domain-containing protein [Mycobacterium hackensackense]
MNPSAPGWYPDPHDPLRTRYWTGSAWTDHAPPPPPQWVIPAPAKRHDPNRKWWLLLIALVVVVSAGAAIAVFSQSGEGWELHANSDSASSATSTAFDDWVPSVCADQTLTSLANGSMANADQTWFCRASKSPSINIAIGVYQSSASMRADINSSLPCYYYAAIQDDSGATWAFVSTSAYGSKDLKTLTQYGFSIQRAKC